MVCRGWGGAWMGSVVDWGASWIGERRGLGKVVDEKSRG